MNISKLTEKNRRAWDEYILGRAEGLPQHLSAWQEIMQQTYGYKTHFLMARDEGGATIGVLPLFFVESMLTGRTATTMPGGLCADSDDVARALLAQGREAATARGATRFVVQDTIHSWPDMARTSSNHVRWVVDLATDEENQWSGLHRNVRRQIRIARKNELTAIVDRSGDSLDDFYNVLSHFTHQAGTPVFPREFAANVMAAFPDSFNIVVIYKDDLPIGGYFQLELGESVHGLWGAALHEHLQLRPVYLAYWTILAEAVRGGNTKLDMGRSPAESNASKFKGQWGGYSLPVYQQVSPLNGQGPATTVTNQTQTNGKLRSFMQLWPRIPFPVAQFLGPKLRRHVPFA